MVQFVRYLIKSFLTECIFEPGYGIGIGGSDMEVGNLGKAETCVEKCVRMRGTHPKINGVTQDAATGKKCFCIKYMTNRDTNAEYKSCMFPPSK